MLSLVQILLAHNLSIREIKLTQVISIACACDENSKAPASKNTEGRQACMYKLLSIVCETQMEASVISNCAIVRAK